MAGRWYCRIEGHERGPFTAAQLRAMVAEGRLSASDPLRPEGSDVWVPSASVKGLLPAPGAAAGSSAGTQRADDPTPKPRSPLRAQPIGEPLVARNRPEQSPHDVGLDLAANPASPARAAESGETGPRGLEFLAEVEVATARPRPAKRPMAAARAQKKAAKFGPWLMPGLLGLLGLLVLVLFAFNYSPTNPSGPSGGKTVAPGSGKLKPPAEPVEKGTLSPAIANEKPAESAPVIWIDASRAAWKCGDVLLTVQSAAIAPATRIDAAQRVSDTQEECLLVHLELSNKSSTRKIEYTSWSVRDPEPQLADELNNKYRMQKVPGGGRFEGQAGSKSIYPEKPLADVLVFERPVEKAKVLHLKLPAGAFGGTGTGYLEIPMSMVKRGAVAGGKLPAAAAAISKGDEGKTKEQRAAKDAKRTRSGFAGAAAILDDSPPQRANDAKTDLGGKPDSGSPGPVPPQGRRGPPPAPTIREEAAGSKSGPK